MKNVYTVGIIGGGISGAVTALQLAENGIDSILLEKETSVVNGPPFCHLHAGGNLYPEISDQQCKELMRQSIEMARLFPESIDERPTFISIPSTEKYLPENIERRLEMLVEYYKTLIDEDSQNNILGEPDEYYKAYDKKAIYRLLEEPAKLHPSSMDEWMINAIRVIDLDELKMPLFLVKEYGWNLFRLAAQAQIALTNSKNCVLKTGTLVTDVKDIRNQNTDYNWTIKTSDSDYKIKYLVNSCGFKTGIIDESLELNSERLIEFKAAYIAKWQELKGKIPELIFQGERGTPHGMAQLTPYYSNFYQIHGMTKEITLFEDGLIKSKCSESQPEFNEPIKQKLQDGWNDNEIKTRTQNAIEFVARHVPSFDSATIGGPPLYGAQQIHGNDPDLRIGEVSFPAKFYARSEIIKASSALTVANKIINNIHEEGILGNTLNSSIKFANLQHISTDEIDELSKKLAEQRGYPIELSKLYIKRK